MIVTRSQGQVYTIPQGTWVPRAMRSNPRLRVMILQPAPQRTFVNVGRYYEPMSGRDWHRHPHGFFWRRMFWNAYLGALMAITSSQSQVVYVVSPVSGAECGELAPSASTGTYSNDEEVYLDILARLAAPGGDNPSAGLYPVDDVDPTDPSKKLNPDQALERLEDNQQIVFCSPTGDFEVISTLEDLKIFLHTREPQEGGAAPASQE